MTHLSALAVLKSLEMLEQGHSEAVRPPLSPFLTVPPLSEASSTD